MTASIPKPKTSMLTEDFQQSSAELHAELSGATVKQVRKVFAEKVQGLQMLKTHVLGFQYDFVTHTGTLFMARMTCCDMMDCVEFFLRIDPNVKRILTIAGRRPDTQYWLRDNGEWDGGLPKHTPIKNEGPYDPSSYDRDDDIYEEDKRQLVLMWNKKDENWKWYLVDCSITNELQGDAS